MGLFPLNIYLRVPGYPTNCPIGYPGNKLPGYGSPTGSVYKTVVNTCHTRAPPRQVARDKAIYESTVYLLT